MNLLLPPSVLFGVALAAALHILTNMSRSGLRQPLPSNLPIESIPTDKRPQPWKNTLPQNDILKRAVKLHKGAVQGTGRRHHSALILPKAPSPDLPFLDPRTLS